MATALQRYTLNSIHVLRRLRRSITTVYSWILSIFLYLTKHKGTKLEHIQQDVKQLEKLPIHIALVVNEKELSHVDLGRIVNWCFGISIHYVSLFDPRGSLKSNVESLHHAVEQEHKNLFSSVSSQQCTVVVSNSDNNQELPHSNNDVHRLLVLSPSDGRGQLTCVARSLCELVKQHRLMPNEVDATLINNKLIGNNCGFPDPNLAIVIGSPPSLLGYLPWHTRLTEILFIDSHHKITYQQFHSLLCRYANTKQRFGK